jgi:hypothetical protein
MANREVGIFLYPIKNLPKILYIPDVNHGVYILIYFNIGHTFLLQFFKIHLCYYKKIGLILKHVRRCKHHHLHPDAKNFFPPCSKTNTHKILIRWPHPPEYIKANTHQVFPVLILKEQNSCRFNPTAVGKCTYVRIRMIRLFYPLNHAARVFANIP